VIGVNPLQSRSKPGALCEVQEWKGALQVVFIFGNEVPDLEQEGEVAHPRQHRPNLVVVDLPGPLPGTQQCAVHAEIIAEYSDNGN